MAQPEHPPSPDPSEDTPPPPCLEADKAMPELDPHEAESNVLRHPFSRAFWLGTVDLRPLGIIRILLGLVTLWDLFRRSEDLVAWHTDLGVLPRQALVEGIARAWRLSLLDMMGTPGMVATFFVVAAVAAFCLTIGFKTRLANVATFFIVISLQERNLGPTDSSDTLYRVLLFWMMFAPAGAVYSLDRALARLKDPQSWRAWPPRGSAVGLRMMQLEILILYFVTSVTKSGDHWRDGSSVYRAMQVWDFARPTADFFVAHLGFLSHPMASATLVLEFSMCVCLWICNLRVRKFIVLAGTLFHLGIEFHMNVGMFSLMMPITYTMFLWSSACDKVDRWLPSFPGVVARAHRWGLGNISDPPMTAWVGRPINRNVLAVLSVMMGTIMWDQVHEVNNQFPRPNQAAITVARVAARSGVEIPRIVVFAGTAVGEFLTATMESLSLWQNWRMFAPNPVFDSGPWTAEGVLQNGSRVTDVLDIAAPGLAHPPRWRMIYSRWNKFRLHVRTPEQRGYLLWLGKYICRQYNRDRRPPNLLDNYELIYHLRPTHGPDEPAKPELRQVMWKHYCIKVPDPR